MFSQGLSLDQAPPISVPFRFFLTAPIFGVLIGLVFLFFPYELIENRYSHIAIGTVHLFTLGMLSMIIFGAMQQMMPVLAGAVIKKPVLFANVVHLGLTLGTLLFSASFIFEMKFLLHAAVTCLGISFLTFFVISIKLLMQVKYLTSTVNAMRLFAIAGLFTALLGFVIVLGHIQDDIGPYHYAWTNAHIVFGLFGFGVLLVMGVAFQVIPMFYVAKAFPKAVENRLPLFIFALLFVISGLFFLGADIYFIKLIIAFLFIIFSAYGIDSLNNRRRPVFDVTLWFWKLSLYMFIISMLNWLFVPQDSSFLLGILFAFGFLYSLLQGMVYKIIPFLAWFHLNSKGYFTVPTMRDMIKEDLIKIHFFMYVSSLFFFLITPFISEIFIYIGAGLFIVSNVMFLINCIIAARKYSAIAKTDPMDMSAFNTPAS